MQENFYLQAAASVTASVAAPGGLANFTGNSAQNSGFSVAGSFHTVAGQYDLLLDTPINVADISAVQVTGRSASFDVNTSYAIVSDTVIRVNTGIAGVASDLVSFSVAVWRRAQS